MDKAGWQVTAGISAIIAIAALVAAVANNRAAAQAYEDLKAARTAKTETVTVHEYHRARCVEPTDKALSMKPWPTGSECKGGVLLRKTVNGWESILSNGRPITCQN